MKMYGSNSESIRVRVRVRGVFHMKGGLMGRKGNSINGDYLFNVLKNNLTLLLIQPAVLNRLRNMLVIDLFSPGQICNRPGYFEDAMVGAC